MFQKDWECPADLPPKKVAIVFRISPFVSSQCMLPNKSEKGVIIMGRRMRALSIRQPYAEEILLGKKEFEYRSQRTKILDERIYIYASLKLGDPERFKVLGIKPGDLPTGVIVGTMEIEECIPTDSGWAWRIKDPRRLKRLKRPKGKPQPVWFYP